MERQLITNYKINKSITKYIEPNAYKVIKLNKVINWIIKQLIKRKVIEKYYNDKVEFNRVAIDTREIAQLIRDLHDDIYFHSEGKPRSVIIGYNKMRELELEMYQEMRFDMALELNGSEGRKIFGLDIILNPRIDGLVLI